MDYQKTAKELMKLLGGKENVISATHCATRLRLVVKNEDLIDKEAIEELEGVKGPSQVQGNFKSFLERDLSTKCMNHLFVRLVLRLATRIKSLSAMMKQ